MASVVETLYESDNFIVVDKPYDMYINSDDENEKVCYSLIASFTESIIIWFLFWGYVYVHKH